jgi:riboflavin kinase/FMN adenylyltransferase
MEIWNFFSVAPEKFQSPIMTIGVFDGVHRGHQSLIGQVKAYAHEIHGQCVVATFLNHPLQILKGKGPSLIMPVQKRLQLLEETGVDVCLLIPFSKEIARIPAEVFIEKYLVAQIGIRGIVIGKNFRFGYEGSGDASLLQKLGERYSYTVKVMNLSGLEGEEISSTKIRNLVSTGRMREAQRMLGRPFSLIGRVIQGKLRGRRLGFPTANLSLSHELIPVEGVYCGYSSLEEKIYPALISIGTCPTFEKQSDLQIEVHLVNFSGDLYDKELETFVWEKIRDQIAFSSQEALCQQIAADQRYLMENFHRWLT